MTTTLVTLDRLRDVASRARMVPATDSTRRIAYLRVGQTNYVAPLAEERVA